MDNSSSGFWRRMAWLPHPLLLVAMIASGLILLAALVSVVRMAGSEGQVCLRVSDNGVGIPPGLDWRKADLLGLRVVQILAKQLGGTVEVCGGEETEFIIMF